MSSVIAPLRLPGFPYLVAAYTVNELGNWLGEIALAVVVFDQTGSPLATAALFIGMHFAPAFLSQGLVARFEPAGTKLMLPLLYLGEAATFCALAFTVSNFSLVLVLGLAVLDGTLAIAARAFTRASSAAILTPAGQLREGNAAINLGFTAAAAAGPALGGLVVAGVGAKAALLGDAASFVIIAAMLALARSLPQVKSQAERTGVRLRAGLRYVRERAVLARLFVAEAIVLVFFTVVIPIEIVYAKETLGAGDAGYGALLSSWGIGMVAGSLVFSAVGHRVSLKPLLLVSTLGIGLSYLGMAGAGTLLLACLAASVGGLGNGVQFVSVISAIQELTEADYQARVSGLLAAIEKAMPGVGFLLGGVIAELVSPRASFLTAGLGVVIVVTVAAPSLARSRWGDQPAARPPPPDEAASEAAELGGALGSDAR